MEAMLSGGLTYRFQSQTAWVHIQRLTSQQLVGYSTLRVLVSSYVKQGSQYPPHALMGT